MATIRNEAIIKDIKAVAERLRCHSLSRVEYNQAGGKYSHYHLYDSGRSWNELCVAAGITSKQIEPVPDEVYHDRLRSVIQALGRYPRTYERKKFGLNFQKSRWPTLNAFIQHAIENGVIQPITTSVKHDVLPTTMDSSSRESSVAAPTHKRPSAKGHSTPPIPQRTRRVKWLRTDVAGFPYAPHDELGVVSLFAILCGQGRLPWEILELSGGKGIDAVCWDRDDKREVRVELKHTLSRSSWNHSFDDLDYVVCWENRWRDNCPKPVIELREIVSS